MFEPNRIQLRKMMIDAWQRHQEGLPIDALQAQIIDVIQMHPEYHKAFCEKYLDKDYLPEDGEINPFFHVSLHLSLREQLSTNRPFGIKGIYELLCQTMDPHEVEHKMMDVLAECLWQAQRDGTMPDEKNYLLKLSSLNSRLQTK